MTTFFLIVTQHIIGDETSHGIAYAAVSPEFSNRSTAIRWASGQFDHDDLNVATVTDGRIVAFGSGMNDFGPDEDGSPHYGHDLDDIARQIGLVPAEADR